MQAREKKRLSDVGVLVAWVTITMVGVPVYYVLASPLGIVDISATWDGLFLGMLFFALPAIPVGLLVGLGQWLILRGRVPWANRWIGGTALGWAIGWGISMSLSLYWLVQSPAIAIAGTSTFLDYNSVFVIVGAGIGLGQWLFIRGRQSRSAWWIAANTLAWLVGLIILLAAGQLLPLFGLSKSSDGMLLLFGLLSLAAVGIITGLALRRLIAQSQPEGS